MIPAPDLDFGTLVPMAIVAVGSLVVLMGEVLLSREKEFLGRPVTEVWVGTLLGVASSFFLILALIVSMASFFSGSEHVFDAANPMVRLDRFSNFACAVILLGTLLSCWLSSTYLVELKINHGEFYALILFATLGMMLTVCSVNLISLFLGFELMSIPIYVLAGFQRRELRSNESALKYFLIGSFASAILLYGMALVYGTTGATDYALIRHAFDAANPLALAGVGLLVVGFAFKISSVPFHQWTPDVYEGAPTAVTAYMSVTVKAAAFAALLRLLVDALGPLGGTLQDLFWVLAALTMIVGNVMAVIQENVKRMLAYSSVAHAGYLLLAFVAGTEAGYSALLFYLLVYLLMNLGAFAVIVTLADRGQECDRFDDYAGLARTRPGLAALTTLFMLSLAGIPGTAGFIAKFTLFGAAVQSGFVGLTIVAVLTSVVSVYYYLRLPVLMYMREPAAVARRDEPSSGELVVLGVCAAGVLFLGFFPDYAPILPEGVRVLEWARQSVAMLF